MNLQSPCNPYKFRHILSSFRQKAPSFLLFSLLALILASCHSEPRKYKIGVSQCSIDDWRDKVNGEMKREAMFHDDVELEILSSDNSSDDQIAHMRSLIDSGCDLIIVSPYESEVISPMVEEAYDKGIPVIVFDRETSTDKYTALIAGDNRSIGETAARYASSRKGSEHLYILEIRGLDGSSPAQLRHDGFAAEIAKNPNAEIVASHDGQWMLEGGLHVADSILRLHPEINIIYAHNDGMAIGASSAVRNLGRKDVMILGVDGAPVPGVKAVKDGIIDATVIYPTEGHVLIRTALAILRGEPFERLTLLPSTSPIDSSNADIIERQNTTMLEETQQIPFLQSKLQTTRQSHETQKTVLWSVVVAAVLLSLMLAVMILFIVRGIKLQKKLRQKNADLEHQQKIQKELYAKLEEATNAKMVFYTNISHDLRTPLTLIADPVEQVAAAPYLSERDARLMKIADKNVRILRRLINQILDFRKYENDTLDFHPQMFRIAPKLKEWSESFKEVIRKRGQHFHLDLERASGIEISGDVEKIERIVFNLLSNAIKNTPQNGNITLKCYPSEGMLNIEVADTGCGIPPEEQKSIFNRFYQVKQVHPQGSGIGLALSKAFAKLHGGDILLESNPGKGSQFILQLPLPASAGNSSAPIVGNEAKPEIPDQGNDTARTIAGENSARGLGSENAAGELDPLDNASLRVNPGTPSAGKPDQPEEGSKPMVLVVEDNADMQALVSLVLAPEYEVICASDGAKGLQLAGKYIPDLIICDVMMPVMDGLEALEHLKNELPTSHIPVMMLTACALDEQRLQGYRQGADSYLPKPFNAEVLLARCRNLIENRIRIRNAITQGLAPLKDRTKSQNPPKDETKMSSRPGHDFENEFYLKFLEIVKENLDNTDLTVDDIAARMGLGQSQFGRKIKALTNYTPVALLRQIRLQEARAMLMSSEKSVSEVAYSVGFSSPAYFSKCFLDAFGTSPTDFRQSIHKT